MAGSGAMATDPSMTVALATAARPPPEQERMAFTGRRVLLTVGTFVFSSIMCLVVFYAFPKIGENAGDYPTGLFWGVVLVVSVVLALIGFAVTFVLAVNMNK
jgi:hypothetical protein